MRELILGAAVHHQKVWRRLQALIACKKLSAKNVILLEVQERGVSVDQDLHDDLLKIMEERHDEALQSYAPDSFHYLFWEAHTSR